MCKCVCLYRSEKRKSRKKSVGCIKKKGTDVSETLPDVIVIYPVARAPALWYPLCNTSLSSRTRIKCTQIYNKTYIPI